MIAQFLEVSCAGWAARRLARSPIAWLLLGLAATGWIAVLAMLPFAWSVPSGTATALAYEVAFLGGLAGSILGLDAVGEAEWILARASPLQRQRARCAVIGTAALLGAAAGLAVPFALGFTTEPAMAARLALSLGWLTAEGAALAAWPCSRAARSLALPFLAWLLPRAITADSRIADVLAAWFDAASLLDPRGSAGWAPCLAALGPIVMWASLPLILSPSARRLPRTSLALRNPR